MMEQMYSVRSAMYAERKRRKRHAQLVNLCIALGLIVLVGMLLSIAAHAQDAVLVRVYHDQDLSGTVNAADIPAAGVLVAVAEWCADGSQVCAASHQASTVTTDAEGYALVALTGDVVISVPCGSMVVQAAQVRGQTDELATCALGAWLPVVMR